MIQYAKTAYIALHSPPLFIENADNIITEYRSFSWLRTSFRGSVFFSFSILLLPDIIIRNIISETQIGRREIFCLGSLK